LLRTEGEGKSANDAKKLIVDIHNLFRRKVDPPAANMLQMVSILALDHRV